MAKGNLLIVDDEPLIVKNLKFTLSEYADAVFTAGNGIEALEILNKEQVNCVICDINMPKMNGVELIKRVREENNDVLFIFYTGHGNRDLMMEAVKYGAFDFLNKPNLDGLEEVVVRGLQTSLSQGQEVVSSEEGYVSEYQKLLAEIESDS